MDVKQPHRIQIAPSILSADFGKLREEVQAVEMAGADLIHLDVMDGKFVPNLTIGPDIVAAVKKSTKLPLDVHLMIEQPENHIKAFIDAGADLISVHPESTIHLHRTLSMIAALGAKPAIALNPSTSFDYIPWLFEHLQMILVMTVNPGFGGQSFISPMLEKIKKIRSLLEEYHRTDIWIEVDGGVNEKNIQSIAKSGANVFVAGSAIFKSSDYARTISNLKVGARS